MLSRQTVREINSRLFPRDPEIAFRFSPPKRVQSTGFKTEVNTKFYPGNSEDQTTDSNALVLLQFIVTCQVIPEDYTEAHSDHLNVQNASRETNLLLIKTSVGQKLHLIW